MAFPLHSTPRRLDRHGVPVLGAFESFFVAGVFNPPDKDCGEEPEFLPAVVRTLTPAGDWRSYDEVEH